MRRVTIYIYSLVLLLFSLSLSDEISKKEIIYSKTEIVVQLKSNSYENKLLSDYPNSKHIILNFYSVKVPENKKVENFIQEIQKKDYIQYADFNYGYKLTALPNDPYFNEQWGLTQIHAPEAWNYTTGSKTVYVAVVDDGAYFNHPDLKANIWKNPDEICNNGKDDDDNGYVDDCYGWSAVNGKGSAVPKGDHGTHVAGIIGAVGNNGIGVSGVNWNVKIIPCGAGDDRGYLYDIDIAECFGYIQKLKYLKDLDIVAINASWGGYYGSRLAKKVLDILAQYDILLVAAAGNDMWNNDEGGSYPCSYDSETVICVGASNEYDSMAWFSNYGKNTVDIFAPGTHILSTVTYYNSPYGDYDFFDGTSMATPFVTGAIALAKSFYPEFNYTELKKKVISSGDITYSLFNASKSGKRLNLENIVNGYQSATYNFDVYNLYFGYLNPGEEQSKTIKIRSTGELPLTINSFELTNSEDFYIKSENCTGKDLNFYEECQVTITFKPTSGYAENSSYLILHSNAENDQKLYIKGYTRIYPYLSVDPDEIVFKNIDLGEESETKEIEIKNGGTGRLTVTQINITGNPEFIFDLSGCPPVPFELKGKESCTINVKYSPLQEGISNEIVSITADRGSYQETKNVYIYATTQKLPDLQLNKNKFYFEAPVGETSPPQIIEIHNKGKADLNIYDIRIDCHGACRNNLITDYNAGTKPCGGIITTIPPNDYCTFSLRYKSTNYYNIETNIYISSNDTFHKSKYFGKVYATPLDVKIKVNPNEINFGEFQIDDKSEFKTITIKNSSSIDAKLKVKNIILANNTDFVLDNGTCGNTPFELNKDESCQIKVKFNPKSTGTKKTNLKIVNNDYENSNIYVRLKGKGLKKSPVITVNPEEIDFGDVQVGKISDEKVATIENKGMLPLKVYSFETKENSFLIDYKGGNNPCNSSNFTLQPKESCTIGIRFAPNEEDDFESKIEINTHAKDGKIEVYGNGTRGIPPKIDVSTEYIDFGKVVVNQTKKQEILISNKTSKSKLIVTDIRLSDKQNFAVNYNGGSNPCGSSSFILPENSECTIELSFVPSRDKRFKTSLEIYSNDPKDDKIKIKVYGEGVNLPPPKMYISSKELDFGALQVGNEKTKEIEIKNIGEGDLNITEFRLKEESFQLLTNYGNNPCNSLTPTISPNNSCTIGIKFKPEKDKSFKSYLEIRSNDPYSSKQKVYLYGRGTENPEGYLYIENEEIDFGAVGIGGEKTKELKISNLGEADLKITNIRLKGDNFQLLTNYGNNPCGSLTPTISSNSSCSIGIKFMPDDDGKFKSSLEIRTEDDKEKIKLYGIGTKDKQPFVIVEPTKINFEDTLIGNSSVQELKIRNIGEQNLKIYRIRVSDSKAFELLTNYGSNPCSILTPTIEPDNSCTIGIKFKPEKEKEYKSYLEINSNDDKVKFNVIGLGVSKNPKKFYPEIQVSPSEYDFGKVKYHGKSKTAIFKIQNTGIGVLVVRGIYSSTNFNIIYDVGDKPCKKWVSFYVYPNDYCTFGVRTNISDYSIIGKQLETIDIIANTKIDKKKKGYTPDFRIPVKIEVTPPDVEPASIDFGTLIVGDISKKEIKILNPDNTNSRTIHEIKLLDNKNFLLDPNSGSKPCGSLTPVIQPNDYCTIAVIFRPVEQVDYSFYKTSELIINKNYNDQQGIYLHGKSYIDKKRKYLKLSTKAIDFEFTNVGDTSNPKEIKISNLVDADIKVKQIYVQGEANPDNFIINFTGGSKPCGSPSFKINGNDFCTITVSFSPISEGFKKDTLFLETDILKTEEWIYLTGRTTADEPYLKVEPRYTDFGTVYQNTLSEIKEFKISNQGTKELVINNIDNKSDYLLINFNDGEKPCGDTFPITLNPNDYCTFSAAYAPDVLTSLSRFVYFDTNDPYSNKYLLIWTANKITEREYEYARNLNLKSLKETTDTSAGGCSYFSGSLNLPIYLLIPVLFIIRRYLRKLKKL